jgi:hypothetical protein
LKDYHREETIDNANSRVRATIEMMKQSRYRERQDFENMMTAMKHEDDIRRRLRN